MDKVNVTLLNLSAEMRRLRRYVSKVPVHTEKIRDRHSEFARSAATLLVEVSYARDQYPD
ncbi:hypothetical protein FHR81_003186 [Actinoalloteichus hoggarensis]|uniref:Uncharacterized protein n=1 Tax=Actinoalloteichus hoggarensis TaxID=1470176 RepID=A0A221W785_9PSEU|nr:hypothetical protein [Actinoalloteichus hoggarensis]ASO21543.1 hypothetical protein AHOG_19605 [Actinoalloteichus hoggarensis]MBB5922134.1 hypothetical protein [Actinoalloteichus hoggarensis]